MWAGRYWGNRFWNPRFWDEGSAPYVPPGDAADSAYDNSPFFGWFTWNNW